jgi:hypothetical protein
LALTEWIGIAPPRRGARPTGAPRVTLAHYDWKGIVIALILHRKPGIKVDSIRRALDRIKNPDT